MWGFELFGKRAAKLQPVSHPEQHDPTPSSVQMEAAAAEAKSAIAKAKLTGDSHISHPHNPSQYGAEHSALPRTEVRPSTPVAESGVEDLRINPSLLERSLENPTELGGQVLTKTADAFQAAARAESLYVDSQQVEAALAAGKLPEAIAIKKAPWQPDMFAEPRTKPLSPTPMGTAADLRSEGGPVGVEDDWEAAKRVVGGSKSEQGLGEFRTSAETIRRRVVKRETVGAGLSEQRKGELRQNAERLILDLRKLIDATKDTTELKSMRARLAMAEKFYDEHFK